MLSALLKLILTKQYIAFIEWLHGQLKKSNLYYTRNVTWRLTSGGVYLSGLAPEQHNSEDMSQR